MTTGLRGKRRRESLLHRSPRRSFWFWACSLLCVFPHNWRSERSRYQANQPTRKLFRAVLGRFRICLWLLWSSGRGSAASLTFTTELGMLQVIRCSVCPSSTAHTNVIVGLELRSAVSIRIRHFLITLIYSTTHRGTHSSIVRPSKVH